MSTYPTTTARWTPRARQAAPTLFCTILTGTLMSLSAAAPEWWTEREVITPNATADDYAMANVGQLKRMAKAAIDHLELAVPGGAGADLEGLLSTWTAIPLESRNDFAALNQGQLKAVGSRIYSRLNQAGLTATPPWTSTTTDDESFAATNLGMLKNVFSFVLPSDEDSDDDGLPDWWEMDVFGSLDHYGWTDSDHDGHLDREEFILGTAPNNDASHGGPLNDEDEDGLLLADEVSVGRNPKQKDHPLVQLSGMALAFP